MIFADASGSDCSAVAFTIDVLMLLSYAACAGRATAVVAGIQPWPANPIDQPRRQGRFAVQEQLGQGAAPSRRPACAAFWHFSRPFFFFLLSLSPRRQTADCQTL